MSEVDEPVCTGAGMAPAAGEQDVPGLVQATLARHYEAAFATAHEPAGPEVRSAPKDGEPQTARIFVEVFAGLIPGTPDGEYTRRWVITSNEWATATAAGAEHVGELLAEFAARAQGYAAWLMMQPDRVNWVQTGWAYL